MNTPINLPDTDIKYTDLGVEIRSIVEFYLNDDNSGCFVSECCDGYFNGFITKSQVIDIAIQLLKMANKMKEV